MNKDLCESCNKSLHTIYFDRYNIERTNTEYFKCKISGNGCEDEVYLCQECFLKTIDAIKVLRYHPNFLSDDLEFDVLSMKF